MLCVEFNRPEVSEYARKKAAAVAMLNQILACLESTPEVDDAQPSDKDVVGLCNEIANQICHDIDLIKELNW